MKKTNSKAFNDAMYAYLLGCITNEEWDSEPSPKEKINYVFERLDSENGDRYFRHHYPNNQDRLQNWLQGLALDIDYAPNEILEVAKKLHEVDGFDDKMEDKILDNWWRLCAFKLTQLRTKLNK